MERNFKRISDELKLPRESRDRIRSYLASYQKQSEIIPIKRTLKFRVPLIIAAVVLAMALTFTAAAAAVRLFQNDIIVPSVDDIPSMSDASSSKNVPGAVAVGAPNGTPPATLEEMTQSERFKSDDWTTGNMIHGGVISEYHQWDSMEVLSNDPALRIRRVDRADGAEKMEYTAEDPINLVDTLTGRITFDLSWMDDQYNYVPDANMAFTVKDADEGYVSEMFSALYAKSDGSGYIRVEIYNVAQPDYFAQTYIVDGSYETAYYYTASNGYEFLVTMDNGNVWAECNMSHVNISLYGAYLSTDEVEDILDNLSLTINE